MRKEKIVTPDKLFDTLGCERTGKLLKCRCLFHKEKTASMFIDEQTNTYHCFGCGKSGKIDELFEVINKKVTYVKHEQSIDDMFTDLSESLEVIVGRLNQLHLKVYELHKKLPR